MKLITTKVQLLALLVFCFSQTMNAAEFFSVTANRANLQYLEGEKASFTIIETGGPVTTGHRLTLQASFPEPSQKVELERVGSVWIFQTPELPTGDLTFKVWAYAENADLVDALKKQLVKINSEISSVQDQLNQNPDSIELQNQLSKLQATKSYIQSKINQSRKLLQTKEITISVESNSQAPEVTLTASTLSGAYPLDVDFEVNIDFADGRELAYVVWDFGLGDANVEFSTETQKSFRFLSEGEKQIMVTVVDNERDSTEATITITSVHPADIPPSASIYLDRTVSKEAPFTINYHGLDSSDPEGEIASYFWDFGDGNTSTESYGEHTYTNPGAYLVSLRVTDEQGQENLISTEVLVTVNCDIDVGDSDICLSVKDSPKRVWQTSSTQMILQTNPAVNWETQDLENMLVLLDFDSGVLDVSALATFNAEGEVIFDKEDLLALVTDFENPFEVRVQHQDIDGESVSVQLREVHLGTGQITGTLNSPGAEVRVSEASGLIDETLVVDGNNQFSLNNLPFGYYTIQSQVGGLFANAGVIVSAFEVIHVDLALEDPFSESTASSQITRKLKTPYYKTYVTNQDSVRSVFEKRDWDQKESKVSFLTKRKLIKNAANRNYKIEEIVFAPNELGSAEKTHIFELEGDAQQVTFAYKVFALAALTRDVFDVSFYYFDESNQKQVVQISEQTSKLVQGEVFPNQSTPLLRSNWLTQNVSVSSTQRQVKVVIRSVNLGRDDTAPADCNSAVGVGYLAGEAKESELIIKRLVSAKEVADESGNTTLIIPYTPNTKFFPVERDKVKVYWQPGEANEMKNPFHFINKVEHEVGSPELDAKYSLVWELELAKIEPGYTWRTSTSGIEVSLKAINSQNSVAKVLPLESMHVQDVYEGSVLKRKIVRVPIELIEKTNFFDTRLIAPENPDAVEFSFQAFTTGTVLSKAGAKGEYAMTPLYNVKRVGCQVYNGGSGRVSMYGLWRVFKVVREMQEEIAGLYCNDLSLPFGGKFYPHKGEGHKNGYAIDVAYIGEDRTLDLVSGARFKLAEDVASGNVVANRKYADWVKKLRENMKFILDLSPGVKFTLADGENFPIVARDTSVIPLGVAWNQDLFEKGFVLSQSLVGSDNLPIEGIETLIQGSPSRYLSYEDDSSHLGHIHIDFK